MSTSTPRAPRLSGVPTGLPTPRRSSQTGLPTPRRSIGTSHSSARHDDLDASQVALSELLQRNPPSTFRSPTLNSSPAGSTTGSTQPPSSAASRRSSSVASSHTSGGMAAPPLPRTPGNPSALRRSLASSTSAFPSTPTARVTRARPSLVRPESRQDGRTPARSSLAPRPESRQDARTPARSSFARPESRQDSRTPGRTSTLSVSMLGGRSTFKVGDHVRMESMGMEGMLRFVGEIEGKAGTWAGVELNGGFAGHGKNDGSAGGISYFECPPMCGLFLQYSKLSSPTVGPGSAPRPGSVASSRRSGRESVSGFSGRATPSISGRATPSVSGRATPSISGRATPSISGRATPLNMQHVPFLDSPPARAPESALQKTIAVYEKKLAAAEEAKAQVEEMLKTKEEELSKERMELGEEIDIIRQANQDAISQYEERLSAADDLRLDLESSLRQREEDLLSKEDEVIRGKADLEEEVESLKKAGQDTISFYEERLNAAEASRLDLEALIRAREEELSRSTSSANGPHSPPSLTRQPSTAAEIDNENLKEQVTHLNKRIADFEDQIEEIQVQANKDEQAFKLKLDKARAAERDLQDELAGVRAEKEEALQAEEAAKLRLKEIELALAQNNSALEGARAEAEGLRSDVANLGSGREDGQNLIEVDRLRKALADTRAELEGQAMKHQSDIDHLQKKVGDIDRLNQQEIAELEGLIESKIYREDELEREIETLKRDLKRATATSTQNGTSSQGAAPSFGSFAAKTASLQDTCELCDEPGHEIEDCRLFSGDLKPSSSSNSPLAHKGSENGDALRRSNGAFEQPWCEDCESYGHPTDNCPYAQEVF